MDFQKDLSFANVNFDQNLVFLIDLRRFQIKPSFLILLLTKANPLIFI